MTKFHCNFYFLFSILAIVGTAMAEPIREWDWHMPGNVYKELEFNDRAAVDRAVKIFQQAIDAEHRGAKAPDLVPRYRAAAGEWRKVQIQGETGDMNEKLLAYAVFMQGYARMQARDRNEAIKIFNEVLDLHGEEKFIAVPARYMLARIKRDMGESKKADADLDEIVEDRAADGHPIFYNVLRDRGNSFWSKGMIPDAIEMWSKIVYSAGKPDSTLWGNTRGSLVLALIVSCNFADLEKALLVRIPENEKVKRRDAIAGNASWVSDTDSYWHHDISRYLTDKFPDEKKQKAKRQELFNKIMRGYASWLDGEKSLFDGLDDGWSFAMAKFRIRALIDKPEESRKRVKALEGMVKSAKPDEADKRARSAAYACVRFKMADDARAMAQLARNAAFRTHLNYEVENELGQYKMAIMYLEEYCGMQPPPSDLNDNRYNLAWMYRHRVHEPDKAVKIYQDLNDPPRSLWGLAEALREAGKKTESYKSITEIISMFPNDAANGTLRMAQWREQDGEKDKAIALYRRILKHPQWKTTGASSEAHQALERHGVATGGAMTNEVR